MQRLYSVTVAGTTVLLGKNYYRAAALHLRNVLISQCLSFSLVMEDQPDG